MEREKGSEIVYRGRVFNIRRWRIELPSGRETVRDVIEHPGSVVVLPLEGDEVILVEQYRRAVGKVLLELPAGTIEDEDVMECGRRELLEETGYEAKSLEKLGEFYSSPGFSSEKITVLLAKEVIRRGEPPDKEHIIGVRKMPVRELLNLIKRGEIEDGKTILSLLLYMMRDML